MANELNVKIIADISSLKAALEQAQAQVKTASENMAQAQSAFGASAAQGNEQAKAALAGYAAEAKAAAESLDALEAAQARSNVSRARPQTAAPSTASSWREEAAAQAAAAQLSTQAISGETAALTDLTAATTVAAASDATLAGADEAEAAASTAVAETAVAAVAATNDKTAANTRYAASTAEVIAASSSVAIADEEVAASGNAVAASSDVATAQNAAFTAGYSRQVAAMAAYNAAAKGSVETTALLGAAFDKAMLSGLGFVESQEAAVAAVEALTASAAGEVAALNEVSAANVRTVSGSMAASGGLGVLTGSMFGARRAAGSLLADTLGLGPALSAAFPIIGAAALLSILYQVGEELVKTIENANNAGEAISRAFGDAQDKLQETNDQLALQNSKLQDEIDKLSGHPGNGLQTALDEDIVAADKLQDALDGVVKQIDAIFAKKDLQIGLGASLLTGQARTGPVTDEAKKIFDQADDQAQSLKSQHDRQLLEVKGDHDKTVAEEQSYHDQLAAIISAANAKIQPLLDQEVRAQKDAAEALGESPDQASVLKKFTTALGEAETGQAVNVSDRTARINDLKKAQDLLNELSVTMQLQEAQEPLEQKKGKLTGEKEAQAAASGAAQQHLRDLEQVFAEEELQYGVSANQTEAYWGQYLNTFKQGSTEFNTVVEKVVHAQEQMGRSVPLGHIGEGLKKAAEQAKEDSKKYVEALDDMRKATVEWQKADAQAAAAAAQHQHDLNLGALEIQGAKVEQASAVGTQTPKTELTDLQALHAQEIAEDERFILEEMAIYAKEPAELDRLQKELDAVHQKGQLQQVEDTTKSLEQQLQLYKQAYSAITSDLNQTIDKLITTTERPAQAFARMFDKILEQLANFVLQWLEKQAGMWLQTEIMQLLGITKQATQQTAQTTAVIAAQTAQTTAITAAQTAQTAAIAAAHATQAASNVAIVTGDAAVAAANTMAFYTLTAPPAAPALAAAAFAATEAYAGLAAFEHGGIIAGSGPVPIMGHAGERVLSAPQTQNFERLVNQPQGGGHSTTLNYSPNINAYDRTGFRSVMQEHSDDLFEMIRQGYAQGKLT